MSRLQLSLNVSDLEAAVTFYTRLLGTPSAKLRPGYANFAITEPPLKLVLNAPGNGPAWTINHLGVRTGSNTRGYPARRSPSPWSWSPKRMAPR